MSLPKKIHCCICGRQIVSYRTDPKDKLIVDNRTLTKMVGLDVACYQCSRDLDENGLFPEER